MDDIKTEKILIDTKNINEKIYLLLKNRIIYREYPPGYKINIPNLQDEFGVSSSPIKDALSILAGEEFVEIIARKGTFVKDITPEDILEIEQIRIIIESAAIEIVAPEITDDEIAALEVLYQDTLMSSQEFDYMNYLNKDFKFHNEIIRLANNKRLSKIYEQLHTHIYIFRFQFAHNINSKFHTLHPLTNKNHLEILETLRKRDPKKAKKAIVNHRNNARKIILGEFYKGLSSNE